MNAPLTSPSFPNGLPALRSEASVRRELAKPCPFCGTDPLLARRINGVFLVGCENDDCHATPQVCAETLSEAWKKWNLRSGELKLCDARSIAIFAREIAFDEFSPKTGQVNP